MPTHQCSNKDVRVTVVDPDSGEESELVTIDEGCETNIRKEGPASINYLTDVYFPLEWEVNGTRHDFSQDVTILGEAIQAQPAYVEFRGHDETQDGDWNLVHHGYTKQIGSGGDGRKMRLQIGDWVDFLGKIPASNPFTYANVEEVLDYVTDTFEDRVTIVDSVVPEIGEGFDSIVGGRGPGDYGVDKSFTANRHTLVDVMDELSNRNLYWWVEGDVDQVIVHVDGEPPRNSFGLDDVSIRNNNAIYEIQPINEVVVRGETPFSIEGFAPQSNTPGDKYPIALARHEELYERAGEAALRQDFEDGAVTIDAAQDTAEQKLIESLGERKGGNAVLDGIPNLFPYDSVEMRPACNEIVNTDVTPIMYEIESLKHVCPATERYASEITVSIHTDPDDIVFPDVEGYNTLAEA